MEGQNELDLQTSKSEPKATNEDLNSLREQIKKSDEEKAALNNALTEERKKSQDTNSRLGDEINGRFNAEAVAIDNVIAAASTELESLEKQQAQFYEEGKFAEAAKLNRQIANAAVRLEKGEDSKKNIENLKTRARADAETRARDPLAAYSPAAKNWINSHPQFLSDKSYNSKVMAAHYAAEADGVTESNNPAEYFKRLDTAVNPKIVLTPNVEEEEMEDENPRVEVKKPAAPSRTSSAAPVSREVNPGNRGSGGNRRIQLTPDEAEHALISYPNLAKEEAYKRYYENQQKLIAAGKITRQA